MENKNMIDTEGFNVGVYVYVVKRFFEELLCSECNGTRKVIIKYKGDYETDICCPVCKGKQEKKVVWDTRSGEIKKISIDENGKFYVSVGGDIFLRNYTAFLDGQSAYAQCTLWNNQKIEAIEKNT